MKKNVKGAYMLEPENKNTFLYDILLISIL